MRREWAFEIWKHGQCMFLGFHVKMKRKWKRGRTKVGTPRNENPSFFSFPLLFGGEAHEQRTMEAILIDILFNHVLALNIQTDGADSKAKDDASQQVVQC